MAKTKTQIGECVVDGCDKEQYAWHMCKLHQRRLRKTGRTDLGKRVPWNKMTETCVIKDCGKKHLSYGFCQAHYKAWIAFCDKHKDPVDWTKFSPSKEKEYISIYRPNHPAASKHGRVMEHRLIMEKMIGRYLERHENVHHKNGIRKDNRPENLELWSVKQPKGQRVEDKIVYAIEILEQYAPHLLSKALRRNND